MLANLNALSILSLACMVMTVTGYLNANPPAITFDNGKFTTSANQQGDSLPDYSYCGYMHNSQPLPVVATKLQLNPSGGDDTEQIQEALDRLAQLPIDSSGWRGALLLSPGTFFVSGSLRLHGDHVVLRGSAANGQWTTIVATGRDRRALIQFGGKQRQLRQDSPTLDDFAQGGDRKLASIVGYVPLGARSISVTATKDFRVGQTIVVQHPSTERWIARLNMNRMATDDPRGSWLDWKAGTRDQLWIRTITRINGERIELDAPLTCALDPDLATSTIVGADSLTEPWGESLGIENLRLISWADLATNPKDEEHAWDAISLNHVQHAWVRNVTMQQFAGSAVVIGRNSRCITVSQCHSMQPVSENANWRKQTYLTYGQQCLFLHCLAEDGRRDFAVGYLAAGPNVFSYCQAMRASHWSGPLGNWATGVLYDNVTMDGAGLALTNRETADQGAGWAAANCALWNCVAPVIECRQPPAAYNWAVGVWGEFTGDGYWRAMNEFVSPDSLLHFQLSQRIGDQPAHQVLAPSNTPAPEPIPVQSIVLPSIKQEHRPHAHTSLDPKKRLSIRNGWFTIGNQLAIGGRQSQSWWRGSVLPSKVAEFGPGLLRYVPGMDQAYYTDSIENIASYMRDHQALVLEQHWGLWYDRRRDDHQMVRRASADCWAPFYEQPWARSGQGQAWDGLSKYDLTRFNAWYFDRLAAFAAEADRQGLVLMYSMYFQHNILEAGAHWADFAWRPANCLQATGFPEPPVYQNRKRVFMAEDFYDVSHPVRRQLHTLYIRHCLDSLSRHSNVVLSLGEEFTGPQHFVEFWLETIAQWQRDQDRDVIVLLSAPRDVQEGVLAKPHLSSIVDAIDMKYWWPTRDGKMYNPDGGQNLAPRQQLRQWQGSKSTSPESLARGVRQLRLRYPDKAVLCSVVGADPWLVAAAGASFVALPPTTDLQLLESIVECQPIELKDDQPDMLGGLIGASGLRLEVRSRDNASAGFLRIDRNSGQAVGQGRAGDDGKAGVYWRGNER